MGFGNMKAEKEYNATKFSLKGLDRPTYDFLHDLLERNSNNYSGRQPHIQGFWKYAYQCLREGGLTYGQYLKVVIHLRASKRNHSTLESFDDFFQRQMKTTNAFNSLG